MITIDTISKLSPYFILERLGRQAEKSCGADFLRKDSNASLISLNKVKEIGFDTIFLEEFFVEGKKEKVPKEGFEPSILAELRPERSEYTNFSTSAESKEYNGIDFCCQFLIPLCIMEAYVFRKSPNHFLGDNAGPAFGS